MYKDKLFQQAYGVAMGSPLGRSLANFFLGHLERTFIKDYVYAPSFYKRYIDDICAIITECQNIQHFLNFINGLHANY